MENESIKNIKDTLNRHEDLINKNTEDIEKIKIDSSAQDVEVVHLKESIEKLTNTIEKTVDKFDNYRFGQSDNWKWIIATIAMPIIFFLLNYIANHVIK